MKSIRTSRPRELPPENNTLRKKSFHLFSSEVSCALTRNAARALLRAAPRLACTHFCPQRACSKAPATTALLFRAVGGSQSVRHLSRFSHRPARACPRICRSRHHGVVPCKEPDCSQFWSVRQRVGMLSEHAPKCGSKKVRSSQIREVPAANRKGPKRNYRDTCFPSNNVFMNFVPICRRAHHWAPKQMRTARRHRDLEGLCTRIKVGKRDRCLIHEGRKSGVMRSGAQNSSIHAPENHLCKNKTTQRHNVNTVIATTRRPRDMHANTTSATTQISDT